MANKVYDYSLYTGKDLVLNSDNFTQDVLSAFWGIPAQDIIFEGTKTPSDAGGSVKDFSIKINALDSQRGLLKAKKADSTNIHPEQQSGNQVILTFPDCVITEVSLGANNNYLYRYQNLPMSQTATARSSSERSDELFEHRSPTQIYCIDIDKSDLKQSAWVRTSNSAFCLNNGGPKASLYTTSSEIIEDSYVPHKAKQEIGYITKNETKQIYNHDEVYGVQHWNTTPILYKGLGCFNTTSDYHLEDGSIIYGDTSNNTRIVKLPRTDGIVFALDQKTFGDIERLPEMQTKQQDAAFDCAAQFDVIKHTFGPNLQYQSVKTYDVGADLTSSRVSNTTRIVKKAITTLERTPSDLCLNARVYSTFYITSEKGSVGYLDKDAEVNWLIPGVDETKQQILGTEKDTEEDVVINTGGGVKGKSYNNGGTSTTQFNITFFYRWNGLQTMINPLSTGKQPVEPQYDLGFDAKHQPVAGKDLPAELEDIYHTDAGANGTYIAVTSRASGSGKAAYSFAGLGSTSASYVGATEETWGDFALGTTHYAIDFPVGCTGSTTPYYLRLPIFLDKDKTGLNDTKYVTSTDHTGYLKLKYNDMGGFTNEVLNALKEHSWRPYTIRTGSGNYDTGDQKDCILEINNGNVAYTTSGIYIPKNTQPNLTIKTVGGSCNKIFVDQTTDPDYSVFYNYTLSDEVLPLKNNSSVTLTKLSGVSVKTQELAQDKITFPGEIMKL